MTGPLSLDRRREVDRLLRVAIDRGSEEDVRAFVDTGRDGLTALRRAMWPKETGKWRGSLDQSENMGHVVGSIAERWPAEFLVVFGDASHDGNDTLVLIGLGRVKDRVATSRLIAATSATRWALRAEAASGLGGRQADDVERALVALLDDPEPVVRLQAINSLASAGGAHALEALGHVAQIEGIRMDGIEAAVFAARMRIEARVQGRPDVLSFE